MRPVSNGNPRRSSQVMQLQSPSPFGIHRNTDCFAARRQVSPRSPESVAPARLSQTSKPFVRVFVLRRPRSYRRGQCRGRHRRFSNGPSSARPERGRQRGEPIDRRASVGRNTRMADKEQTFEGRGSRTATVLFVVQRLQEGDCDSTGPVAAKCNNCNRPANGVIAAHGSYRPRESALIS